MIVLAGEDQNDRTCLRLLLEAFAPDLCGRIVEISDKVRLREATGRTLDGRVGVLANKVRARAIREKADIAGVFVHEDLDDVDGDRCEPIRQRVQAALDRQLPRARYVLAAWEIEAWLLLFPDALVAYQKSWKVPGKYRNRDTGLIADPKKVLMKEISCAARRYRESDAPRVLSTAIGLDRQLRPTGTNRSWHRIVTDAGRLPGPDRGV